MGRYVGLGGTLGAVVVAVAVLFDPRMPRDAAWMILFVVLAPVYLPASSIAFQLGLAEAGVVGSGLIANSLFYAAAGGWLWHASGRPLLHRVGPIVLVWISILTALATLL